ncbi:hypothetical protein NDU88_003912 [Pleurodeles waltl]|uniref:Uncharacterized protein n=1 Tax=Pleurodeles waltl TaxID=8319 RepID=A0AAV7LMW9_PLEWA|nr:hypothetical protein NDU88_003912 [Pleurodeles waltl]
MLAEHRGFGPNYRGPTHLAGSAKRGPVGQPQNQGVLGQDQTPASPSARAPSTSAGHVSNWSGQASPHPFQGSRTNRRSSEAPLQRRAPGPPPALYQWSQVCGVCLQAFRSGSPPSPGHPWQEISTERGHSLSSDPAVAGAPPPSAECTSATGHSPLRFLLLPSARPASVSPNSSRPWLPIRSLSLAS